MNTEEFSFPRYSKYFKFKIAKDVVFKAMLDTIDGDYVIKAQMLAAMKPEGW